MNVSSHRTLPLLASVVFSAALLFASASHAAAPPPRTEAVTDAIDRLLAEHWRQHSIRPAPPASDQTLFRRLSLDLAGRIPTVAEIEKFQADRSAKRYASAVRRLLASPEFSWHIGAVLDDMIQGPFAGNSAFLGYLRASVKDNKPWDRLFREVIIGPWDTPQRKPAMNFLDRRARNLDQLTADVTRSFFGVDISCARCHNHPLVKDWKQQHYYGMAAFLVRTTGGRGSVSEKREGEARFAGRDGKERVAGMMFLSGRTMTDPPPKKGSKYSRRGQLVRVALEERGFLSRAFVNRTWEYFFGRGLVDPVDQIHSGNPASVPALLDFLADDFARSGYDVRRLITGIVLSKAYRLDGRWPGPDSPPDPKHFAVATLRPLSPRQLATSLLIAAGNGSNPSADLVAIEKQSAALLPTLDRRTREFQSSAREALFLSNSEVIRKLIATEGNLAGRLVGKRDDRERVRVAFLATLGRLPTDGEAMRLVRFLEQSGSQRREACEDLVWALVASAEFRFNH